jgi:Cu+-exporting ATPase
MDESHSAKENEKSSAHVSSAVVRLAVGGMTCVACSRVIIDALSEIEGVSDISVNQVGKSASAVVTTVDLVESIATVIEDIGYECKVISVTPVVALGTSGRIRTVALECKGMEILSVPRFEILMTF